MFFSLFKFYFASFFLTIKYPPTVNTIPYTIAKPKPIHRYLLSNDILATLVIAFSSHRLEKTKLSF